MEVYGMWWGGESYSEGDMDSLEKFPSIEDAKYQFWLRYASNGKGPVLFDYVNRNRNYTFVPTVTESSTLKLYFYNPTNDDNGPDRIISFGPRKGVRVEKV